jgi:hypothetical protein
MNDLIPRTGNRLSRSAKQQRAYQLVLAGGGASAVAVVGLVLAVVGVIGFGLPVVAAIVAIVCAVLFRRTVSS